MKPLNIELPGDTITLLPACCIHFPIGERHLLDKWVALMKETKDARTIILGDSMDVARTHFRDYVSGYRGDGNSQEAFDAYVREDVRKLAAILMPVKKKIIGTMRGNHYWPFMDGTNTEQYLAHLLGVRYIGDLGLIRLKTRKGSVVVYAHHSAGGGGAQTAGGDMSSVSRQELRWDADIYLAGHTHRRLVWKESKMAVGTGDQLLVEHTKVFARCGAFLQGYKVDNPTTTQRYEPGYAEAKSYRPTDLGWVEIRVKFKADGRPEFVTVS
jgi:predicted phosphodiesterase